MEEQQLEKVVVFTLGKEEFGVPIHKVNSIEKMQVITPLPQMPKYMKGVMNLRESVIPVVDLRRYLTGEEIEQKEETRIIVAEDEGKSIGFIVDKATEVIDIHDELVEELTIKSSDRNHLIKIAKLERGILILLDISKLLNEADPTKTLKEIAENIAKD